MMAFISVVVILVPINTTLVFFVNPTGFGSSPALAISAYGGLTFNTGSNTESDRMVISSSGNVGIGTTGPSQKLQVAGSARIDTSLGIAMEPTYTLDVGGSIRGANALWVGGFAPSNTAFGVQAIVTDQPTVVIKGKASQTADLFQWQNSTGTVLGVINSNGNVGIGTTGPSQKLDVAGSINLTGGIAGGTTYSGSGNITSTAGVLTISGTGNSSIAGNVGIGTTVPGAKLDVVGTSNFSGQMLNTSTADPALYFSSTPRMVVHGFMVHQICHA